MEDPRSRTKRGRLRITASRVSTFNFVFFDLCFYPMLSLSDILNKKRCAVSLPPQKKQNWSILGQRTFHNTNSTKAPFFSQTKLTDTLTFHRIWGWWRKTVLRMKVGSRSRRDFYKPGADWKRTGSATLVLNYRFPFILVAIYCRDG